MSAWRGQGGRRAKGRRGDQDPELDNNTAWLAELEREAAQTDDEEEDWASTLRSRRAPDPPPPFTPPPTPAPAAPDPGWTPETGPLSPTPDYRGLGMEPDPPASTAWDPDPAWSSWHQDQGEPAAPRRDAQAFGEPERPPPTEPEWSTPQAHPDQGLGEPAGPDAPTGAWQPAEPDAPNGAWQPAGTDSPTGGWQPAGVDTPTGAWSPEEPVGREPDYPALFGELYRRSAARQDPVWEAPPVAEPLPDPAQTDPPVSAWPFEETTQTWEPSERSFIWPADELPATSTEWEPAAPPAWMEEPDPPPATPPPPAPAWSSGPGHGTPPPAPTTPPPADWAAAIPTDVPAAMRSADPGAATRAWRPDEAVEAEPAVPLGPSRRPPAQATPSPTAEARRSGPPEARRIHQADDRARRSWPRIVAVVSWIVLLMVVCWFYVFPWLERILPENF
jgi:hypothetical protein